MLVITLLAGLAPLTVIAAPISQVEGDIVRRANEPKAGDKFHVDGHEHTLGHRLGGEGSTGSVHTVQGHDHAHLAAKVFHKDVKPKDKEDEIKHLKQVKEFHGEAKTEHGHHIVLAEKKNGVHITQTNAYKNAETNADRKKVVDHAKKLVIDRNTHHANKHDLIHTDTHENNVLFEENEHGLSAAHFVDWGLASPAKKDKDGKLTKESERLIEKHSKRIKP